jgi:DNA-binding winged helix-turn-helix (wHTH) protein/tetratricopeptide (TPR) repeat protein
MDSNSYSFSGLDIHPSTREVCAIKGTAELEPRAFDLLLCLVQHRDRVVTKEELLDKVWKTPHVSESVLARAVMKLRKGIADVGGNPDVVKTIHRVGYRFLADEKEGAMVAVSPPLSSRRFVLLPFVNDTQDPLMAWVELGLNTLVSRSIAASSGIAAVPIEDVLRSLALGVEDGPLPEKVAIVKRSLGVESVFSVSVSCRESGFVLRWQAWLADEQHHSDSLEGSNLTSLAVPLAEALQKLLAPHIAARPLKTLTSDEEFMNAAHARALHAFASHNYPQALSLIEICLAITPHPLQVDVDHIEILAMLDGARASDDGLRLLAEIDDEKHPKEKLTLLCALAQSAMTARDWNRCEALCDEIDRRLVNLPDPFSAQWSWYLRFEIAHERGEVNIARHLARQAVQHYRDRNDFLNHLGWLTELAKLELSKGDWARGRSLINDAMQAARSEAKPPTFLATPLNNLALTSIWRGLVPEALILLEQALPLAHSQKTALVLAASYVNLYLCHSEGGDASAAIAAMDQAEPFIERTATRLLAYGGAEVDRQIRFGSLELAYQQSLAALKELQTVDGVHRTFGLYVIGLIAHDALDEAEFFLEDSNDYQAARGSSASWNYLHARAHLHYAKHQPQATLDVLEQYVVHRGSLGAAFQGATDLFWMHLELGDPNTAMALASEISDHLQNTVRGRLCSARLAFVRKDFSLAVAIQEEVVRFSEGRRALPYFKELLQVYRRAAKSSKPQAFPRSELLPSLL